MDFSKLKLANYLLENAAGVEITSNNPAARVSQASASQAGRGQSNQSQGTMNNRSSQTAQSTGNTTGGQGTNSALRKKSPKLSGADATSAGTLSASYDKAKAHRELHNLRESAKSDWRQEIMEAANPNDDPNHPFVEVMPYNDFRMKEAQGLMKKAAAKDKMAGGVTNMGGMKEEKEILTELLGLGALAGKAAGGAVAKATAGAAAKGGMKKVASKVATNVASNAAERTVNNATSKNSDD